MSQYSVTCFPAIPRRGSDSARRANTVAGRYVVMCFFGTARDIPGRAALEAAQANRDLFDDEKVCFFGVSLDPQDQETGRVREMLPGLRYVWDFDGSVGHLYGAVPENERA